MTFYGDEVTYGKSGDVLNSIFFLGAGPKGRKQHMTFNEANDKAAHRQELINEYLERTQDGKDANEEWNSNYYDAHDVSVDELTRIFVDQKVQDIVCVKCQKQITENAVVSVLEALDCYCYQCVDPIIATIEKDATAYAEKCRITHAPALYDDEHRHAVTREEYEQCYKDSYTANSTDAHNRHECTNYDELLKDIPNDAMTIKSHSYYRAIRDRVEYHITEEIRKGYVQD